MSEKGDNQEVGVGSLEDLFFGKKENEENIAPLESLELTEESSLKRDNNPSPISEDLKAGEEVSLFSEKQKKAPVVKDSNERDYRAILKLLFGDEIQNITIENEQGEEVEVSIDEVDVDESLFKEISNQMMKSKKEQSEGEFISAKGLSDFAKRMIDIDRNGGDIRQLMDIKKNILNPLDNIDITTKEGQISVIYMRQRASSVPDEDTAVLIDGWERAGVLHEKAELAEGQLRSHIEKQIKHSESEAIKLKKEADEKKKVFKKDFKDNLNLFQLNDNAKNRLTEFATKEVMDSGLHKMDLIYSEFRNNPEKSAKLALFLFDTEEYDRQISNEMVKKTKLETASKIRVVRNSSGFKPSTESKSSSDFGSLDELMKL